MRSVPTGGTPRGRVDSLAAARRRHPSLRSPVPPAVMRHRVAGALASDGAHHPQVAAAVLSARGAAGLDPDAFALAVGIDVDLLCRAEAGELAPDELPGALRQVVPAGS